MTHEERYNKIAELAKKIRRVRKQHLVDTDVIADLANEICKLCEGE